MIVSHMQYNVVSVVPFSETLPTGQTLVDFNVEGIEDSTLIHYMTKRCLWNMTAHASDVVVLRVCKLNGNPLPSNLFRQALSYGLSHIEKVKGAQALVQTQSSIKSGTAYCLPYGVFSEFVDSLGLDWATDGGKFASYAGLWFSDVAGDAVEVENKIEKATHGEDGNGMTSVLPSGQVRIGKLNTKSMPAAAGKGVVVNVKALRQDERKAVINDTMIKLAPQGEGDLLMAPTALHTRMRKIPATWMLVHMLKDVPEVHEVLEARVRQATRAKLDQLTGPRINLLRRQGQLRLDDDGNLIEPERNVFSALRSNMPHCVEIEERLGRLWVRDLTRHIAPSGGLTAKGFVATQHDELGVRPCEKDDGASMLYRVPIVSVDNISWVNRKLRNGLVHPSIMDRAQGDSDGDLILSIDDDEIVQMFKDYLQDFHAGVKPDKCKSARPITRDGTVEDAIRGYEDGALVGPLTMLMHEYLCMEGDAERAAEAGMMAQAAPMTIKWDITVHGQSFQDRAKALIMARQIEKKEAGITGPQWREMQRKANDVDSPRELRHLSIENPQTLIDRCWNWMVDEVAKWDDATRPDPLSLPAVARLAYTAHPDLLITNEASQEANEIKQTWGEYWSEWFKAEQPERDHSPIYRQIEEMGKEASIAALVKLLEWVPRNSTGAAVKFCAVGKRWEQVLGYHTEVVEWITSR